MPKISIDYDNCLSEKHIQKIAKNLIAAGHDVYILSSRNDGIKRIDYSAEYGTNEVVYRVAEEVGIKPWKICFTNQTLKYKYLANTKIDIHVDDDKSELVNIKHMTKVKGFECTLKSFEQDLFEHLEIIKTF